MKPATASKRATHPAARNSYRGKIPPFKASMTGKRLIAYRHLMFSIMSAAEGDMKHAAMQLGWGRVYHPKALRDLARAAKRYGRAQDNHGKSISHS